jgi:integrase
MPKVQITSTFVRGAGCNPSKRKTDFFDTDLPGFLLEVRQSGGKTFYQRYRDTHGRERQYKIGSAKLLTVRAARGKARAIAAQATLGNDPQAVRQELRAMPSFNDFVRDQYLPFAKNSKRSWRTDETLLRLHILPALGRFSLDEVDDKKVGALLRNLTNSNYSSGTTNRVTILIRFIFNLARKWGVVRALDNPAVGFKIVPDVCRERFLSEEEFGRLMLALDADENHVAAAAIKLLALTGARRNEITYARWEYIDWHKRTLLVPKSKNGKARLIHLNQKALALLKQVPALQENPYIFPSPVTGSPSSSLHFPWTRIRRRAGLKDVRLHDLRHSFASFLVNDGVEIYTVQKLLGHLHMRTTQRYAHLTEDTLSEAVEVMGKLG